MQRGPAPGTSIALPNISSAAETTMQLSAFEPYRLLFAEIYRHAIVSDRALRAAVATRRLRNRVVNTIYARMPSEGAPGARGKRWIQQALSRGN